MRSRRMYSGHIAPVTFLARIFLACIFLALIALVLPSPASATSVKLTYEGHQGATAQGGSPFIGYPYYFSINGSSSFTPLMCDSYDNTVSLGQSFTATVSPFLQGISTSMFGASMTLDYKAAGLIFKSMLAGNLTRTQAQWAIWGLFSTNAQNNSFFSTINGGSIDATYLTLAQNAPNSSYSGLLLYTPVGAKPGVGPQEYIGYSSVPEPGTLTLFGTGLVALAAALRLRFVRV
jgi:hypothetical protein